MGSNDPFKLSPIHQMHFDLKLLGQNHFNKSIFLKFRPSSTLKVSLLAVPHSLETIIKRHSMLRVRFDRADNGLGEWMQSITDDVSGSYYLSELSVSSLTDFQSLASTSQIDLNIKTGPLLHGVDILQNIDYTTWRDSHTRACLLVHPHKIIRIKPTHL